MSQSVKISSPVIGKSKVVKDECCCFAHHPFNHNINADLPCNDKIIFNNENDDLAYSYSYNSQTTNSKSVEVIPNVLVEDSHQLLSDFKNFLSIDYSVDSCQNDENSFKDYGSNMNANDLSVNCTGCHFNHNGLKINSGLNELDISDYNLEYSMFTNLDIIIANANKTATSTMTSNNFNQNPSIECITDDNYGVTDYPLIATFFETVSPIEADISTILILGELKCLN